MTILQLNARSLRNKFDDFCTLVELHNPAVIIVTETSFKSTEYDSEYSIPEFNLFRRDRPTHGGGVAIYVKRCIPAAVVWTDPYFEILGIEVVIQSSKDIVYLFAAYRPNGVV